ncbi:MAG: AAA family ATPase [bacterium]
MKIAVTGKGGVGKTTFTALLCHMYESEGAETIAVDADPDANLASTLGFPKDTHPAPISGLKDLIRERTGAEPGSWGGVFKLNPKVDDIPDKFCAKRGSLSLMVMGAVEKGGKGCVCPESAFLKALAAHIVLQRGQHLFMDMEAGLEHLGRGTARGMDALVVVTRPDSKSVETARRIIPLWRDLGDKKLFFVGNEARGAADLDYFRDALEGYPLLGVLPESDIVRGAARDGKTPFDDPAVMDGMRRIRMRLEEEIAKP